VALYYQAPEFGGAHRAARPGRHCYAWRRQTPPNSCRPRLRRHGNDFWHGPISCGLAARAGVYPRGILAGAAANGRRA